MALTARNRVAPVDFLHIDIEYATISYYVEGSRNDIGEPSRTLTERSTNVKCSLYALIGRPSYINQAGTFDVNMQGILDESTHLIVFEDDTTVDKGDIITDYDSVNYEVKMVTDFYTHKEAYVKKLT